MSDRSVRAGNTQICRLAEATPVSLIAPGSPLRAWYSRNRWRTIPPAIDSPQPPRSHPCADSPRSLLSTAAAVGRADQFDYYTHPVLSKAASDGSSRRSRSSPPTSRPTSPGSCPTRRPRSWSSPPTTSGSPSCWSRPARQKIAATRQAPLLLIDKYTTFKGTSERADPGERARPAPVPRPAAEPRHRPGGPGVDRRRPDRGGRREGPEAFVRQAGRDAKLYVLAKPIAGRGPEEGPEAGRRRGVRDAVLRRPVQAARRRPPVGRAEAGSQRGGRRSPGRSRRTRTAGSTTSRGRPARPRHAITFSIKFPATTQTFTGFMFTGDGKAIAGTTKMLEREAGFYAERIEE